MTDDAWRLLSAVWARYDGRRRNPFNEIECGDHYARAMAGWSALDAMAGLRHDANSAMLALNYPALAGQRLPVLLNAGWGLVSVVDGVLRLECTAGTIELLSLRLDGVTFSSAHALVDAHPCAVVVAGQTAAADGSTGLVAPEGTVPQTPGDAQLSATKLGEPEDTAPPTATSTQPSATSLKGAATRLVFADGVTLSKGQVLLVQTG